VKPTLSIPQLAERCQKEAIRFQRSGQSDPTFCYELFRLALTKNLDEAWSRLVAQYQVMVIRWAFEFGANDLNEEPTLFANEAFSRMWQYGRKPETAAKLDSLGKCLSYLKKCVWSAVEDYRQRRRHELLVGDWQPLEAALPQGGGLEQQLIVTGLREAVRTLLAETIQNEKERRVAEALWLYDLKPRQVPEQYPDLFTSAAEVSQIRKNIIKRIQRKLAETEI
jgi:hypothetical protein